LLIWLYFKTTLCILVVYESPAERVTGDLFVSTISWDRRERRGAGYRSIPEVLQHQLPVDPSAHACELEFLIFRSVRLIPIRVREPMPLFENNTYIYIIRVFLLYFACMETFTVLFLKNIQMVGHKPNDTHRPAVP
jgi:hypothetical protein